MTSKILRVSTDLPNFHAGIQPQANHLSWKFLKLENNHGRHTDCMNSE